MNIEHHNRRREREQGFTLIELLCVISIITIIAALAVGHFNRAMVAANERASVSALRVAGEAQATFRLASGDRRRYAHLGELADEKLIDKLLGGGGGNATEGARSSYLFKSTIFAPAADDEQPGYIISAIPRSSNFLTGTGTRRFAVDDSGVIYEDRENLDTHYTTKESLRAGTSGPFKP